MLERKVTFLFCIIKYENFLTCSWLLKGDTIQGAVLWRTLGSKKMENAGLMNRKQVSRIDSDKLRELEI